MGMDVSAVYEESLKLYEPCKHLPFKLGKGLRVGGDHVQRFKVWVWLPFITTIADTGSVLRLAIRLLAGTMAEW